MTRNFRIGDRVLMTEPEDHMMTDRVGTIICIEDCIPHRLGIDFGIKECNGWHHDLRGHLDRTTGWFVSPSRLRLAELCAPIDVEGLI